MSLDGLADPRLLPYRDARDADLRGAHDLFLVESPRCVARFLRACQSGRWQARSVLAGAEHLPLLAPLAERAACPLITASREEIERWSGYRFHHGALALGEHRPAWRLEELTRGLSGAHACVILADGVVHVDNIGSLFRNAACLGASAVVLGPGCADPLGRKCIRISMGRVFGVPFAHVEDLVPVIGQLAVEGVQTFCLEQSATAVPLHAWQPPSRVALVVGAEGRGVAPPLQAACHGCVEIASAPDPLAGPEDGPPSLNVATALAIVLHGLHRRGGAAGGA
ncbi:MAG: hypothetical protein RLZZ558_1152 [Planctomycetota bacterium]